MSEDGRLPRSIVIPLANPRTASDLVRIGTALLAEGGSLTALSIVEVPEGVQLSEGATRARQARRLLQRVLEFVPEGVDLRTVVRIGRRADEGIVELAAEEEANLILFGWGGPARGKREAGAEREGPADHAEPVFSPTIDEVIRERPCDIAVVKQRGVSDVRRIVAPVRGGPHAELAMRYAMSLAANLGAELKVLHVIPPGLDPAIRSQAERALATFVERHTGDASSAVLVEGEDVIAAILAEAEHAQLIIMGATATAIDSPGAPLFGQLVERVAQEAKPTVMVVKTRELPTRATFEARASDDATLEAADRAADALRSLPARVDRWFAESSFDHKEFADLHRLVELKEKQGLAISAVLPTLNESATIGPIVRAARRELMENVPLVDELLVIDSDSTDDTRAIAEAEGARVVMHQQVLPRYGSYRGKGEALWKSLYETSGDIVAWSDTDISDWHPRFFYGTIGPLLTEPRLGYVKAHYQRPIVEGGVLTEGGGGRVTELVARPLINLFFPELSGYIQPLSGEYAGRREHLEAIPFFTGYAVEIGHLIDLSERLGIAGLGQVDLDVRHHRNQDLEGLSRMAFVILQAVMKRLEERGRTRLLGELGRSIKLPRSSTNRLSLEVIELADTERPPMVRVPEYRLKRGLGDLASER
jgi:nucleotide-binding universal stress UspA family protein